MFQNDALIQNEREYIMNQNDTNVSVEQTNEKLKKFNKQSYDKGWSQGLSKGKNVTLVKVAKIINESNLENKNEIIELLPKPTLEHKERKQKQLEKYEAKIAKLKQSLEEAN